MDPLSPEYPELTPYQFASNSPIFGIDLDGLELLPTPPKQSSEAPKPKLTNKMFFIGGSGGDQDGWSYTQKFKETWGNLGINNFRDFNNIASRGQFKDILYTTRYSSYPWYFDQVPSVLDEINRNKNRKFYRLASVDPNTYNVAKAIANEIPKNHSGQLNLSGYSFGSVIMSHVALALADEGYTIDNLILLGSPIPINSELYQSLLNNPKIKNVQRYDIEEIT